MNTHTCIFLTHVFAFNTDNEPVSQYNLNVRFTSAPLCVLLVLGEQEVEKMGRYLEKKTVPTGTIYS